MSPTLYSTLKHVLDGRTAVTGSNDGSSSYEIGLPERDVCLFVYLFNSSGCENGRGEGGMRPGWHCAGGRHLEGRKYGILRVGRFWRVGVCIADSDILHPFNTPLVLGPHPLTVSAQRLYTKPCVHQEIYIPNLTDHPSCKTVEDPYFLQLLFTGSRNSMFCTIHVFPNCD